MKVVRAGDSISIFTGGLPLTFDNVDEAIWVSEEIAEKVRELRPCDKCGAEYGACQECDQFNNMWKPVAKPQSCKTCNHCKDSNQIYVDGVPRYTLIMCDLFGHISDNECRFLPGSRCRGCNNFNDKFKREV